MGNRSIIKDIALLIVAILLTIVLLPLSLLYVIFIHLYRVKYKRILFNIAYAIDRYGNTVCEEIFNDFLRVEGSYKFGNSAETISSVLGKLQMYGGLTMYGMMLCSLLDTIDNEHCKKSINENV